MNTDDYENESDEVIEKQLKWMEDRQKDGSLCSSAGEDRSHRIS